MVQWARNLTAEAWIAMEKAQVLSPAQCSGLKDPALPQLQCRLQLQLGFSYWPRNFHMPQMWPKKKIYIYIYIYTQLNHFAVHLKLTHYKSTTLQFKIKEERKYSLKILQHKEFLITSSLFWQIFFLMLIPNLTPPY